MVNEVKNLNNSFENATAFLCPKVCHDLEIGHIYATI